MRKETIVKTYLTFDELNESQRKFVLDKYRTWNVDHDSWYDFVYEDQNTILKLLGFDNVEIKFRGFWSQGDGASFTGRFKIPKNKKELKERIKAVKEYAPDTELYNYESMEFSDEEREEETLNVYRITQHYVHYNTITSDNDDLKMFAREYSKHIYRELEKAFEDLTSDEEVRESLIANEIEFDEDELKGRGVK